MFIAIQAQGQSLLRELFRGRFRAQRRGGTQGGGSKGTHRSAGAHDQCRSHSAGLGRTGLPRRAGCTAWSQAAPPPRAGFSPGSKFELIQLSASKVKNNRQKHQEM